MNLRCMITVSLFALVTIPFPAHAQPSPAIRLNQIRFYPSMPKVAVVKNAASAPFYVIASGSMDTVFRGTLSPSGIWPYSGESVSRADFSALHTAGTYVVSVPGTGTSYPFAVEPRVLQSLAAGTRSPTY